jgi:hypothetical protein
LVVGVAADFLENVVLAETRMHFWVSATRFHEDLRAPRKIP